MIQFKICIILLFFIPLRLCCHPECRYACDDPVCSAVCTAVISKPACMVQCNSSFVPSRSQCKFSCNQHLTSNDQCESDHCPMAETQCTSLTCTNLPQHVGCQIVCEAISSSWLCKKPTNCRLPICELMCEHPTCEFSSGNKKDFDLTAIVLQIAIILHVVDLLWNY